MIVETIDEGRVRLNEEVKLKDLTDFTWMGRDAAEWRKKGEDGKWHFGQCVVSANGDIDIARGNNKEYYPISHTQLDEDDWILHMAEKSKEWLNHADFVEAYLFALTITGHKTITMKLVY